MFSLLLLLVCTSRASLLQFSQSPGGLGAIAARRGDLQGAPREASERRADQALGGILLMGTSVHPQKSFEDDASLFQTQMNTSSLVEDSGRCAETSG